ncbi:hypothetical protein F5Y18DRAFT_107129 [Xylariaceae sp. FL1019]|nr:hypothetical protein F5Y18DRAFT_107129 [Xylariaceae sp. FL1019]
MPIGFELFTIATPAAAAIPVPTFVSFGSTARSLSFARKPGHRRALCSLAALPSIASLLELLIQPSSACCIPYSSFFLAGGCSLTRACALCPARPCSGHSLDRALPHHHLPSPALSVPSPSMLS